MTPVPALKAILFDLDGTLVNTGPLILESFRYTVKTVLGAEAPPEELVAAVGTPLIVQMERLARAHLTNPQTRATLSFFDRSPLGVLTGDLADQVATLRETLMTTYSNYCALKHDELILPYEGIEEQLKLAKSTGILLAVVTSKRRIQAEQDIAHFGLDHYFDVLLAADDYEYHKPDPRPLLHAMGLLAHANTLELKPSDCAYIGDSPYDLIASKAAGMLTVAVSWGLFEKRLLMDEYPDVMYDDVTDLGLLLK